MQEYYCPQCKTKLVPAIAGAETNEVQTLWRCPKYRTSFHRLGSGHRLLDEKGTTWDLIDGEWKNHDE